MPNWNSFYRRFLEVDKHLNVLSCDALRNIIESQTSITQPSNLRSSLKTKETNLNVDKNYDCENDGEDDEIIPTIDIGTQTSFYLSEVDPMTLEDDVILANFCDQDERLVCLVCYKIFPSNIEQDLALFKKHLSSHKKASLKKVKVLQRKSSSVSPCYSDDIHPGKLG